MDVVTLSLSLSLSLSPYGNERFGWVLKHKRILIPTLFLWPVRSLATSTKGIDFQPLPLTRTARDIVGTL